jgi:hypothetical protein
MSDYPCITQLIGERDKIGGVQSLTWFVSYRVKTSAADTTEIYLRQADIRKQYGNKGWDKMIKQFLQSRRPTAVKVKKEEPILDI